MGTVVLWAACILILCVYIRSQGMASTLMNTLNGVIKIREPFKIKLCSHVYKQWGIPKFTWPRTMHADAWWELNGVYRAFMYWREKCFSSPLDSFLYLITVEGRRVMDYGFYDYWKHLRKVTAKAIKSTAIYKTRERWLILAHGCSLYHVYRCLVVWEWCVA